MPRRLRSVLVGGASVLAAAACGDDVDAGPPVSAQTIVSTETAFDVEAFAIRAGEEVTVTYENRHDGVPHNIRFDLEGGDEPATRTENGPVTQELSFRGPPPGEYDYVCDVHPAQMRGTLVVEGPSG